MHQSASWEQTFILLPLLHSLVTGGTSGVRKTSHNFYVDDSKEHALDSPKVILVHIPPPVAYIPAK